MPSAFQSHKQLPVSTTTANAILLLILRTKEAWKDTRRQPHVVFIESRQARERNEPYLELPRGTFDASGNITGPLVEEMSQELSLKLRKEQLINLTSLMIQNPHCRRDSRHPDAVIKPEHITPRKPVILWQKDISRKEMNDLIGRCEDETALNAKSGFRVLDYGDLWKAGKNNAEIMAAWAMYENLLERGGLELQIREAEIGVSIGSTK
ncbi:hypothetical protein GT037_006784 [Alternaria burnsii]|uniref:Nudix hydrolase domain-containing protein n=1 Tax=Alternaria burnsii TaxID=1187904 RepID=A0A8H7B5P2_9PLEO|nr:uncharacterized protein GT037_006784 [Alternaria burnsii]KAF7675021.1 hypothetical protein GT037_006784 [Alternaria burnsii]